MTTQIQVMQVVRKVYEELDGGTNDSALHTTEFFMDCRKEFDNLNGTGKEKFFEIVSSAIEEFEKPMVKSSYHLALEEERLKEELIAELYQVSPDGPREVRLINAILQSLRGEGRPMFNDALGFVSDELQDAVRACWPEEVRAKQLTAGEEG